MLKLSNKRAKRVFKGKGLNFGRKKIAYLISIEYLHWAYLPARNVEASTARSGNFGPNLVVEKENDCVHIFKNRETDKVCIQ